MGKLRDQGALPLAGDSRRRAHLFRVLLRFIFDCTMVGSLCGTATEPTPGPSTKPILKLILWCEGTLSEQPMRTGQGGVVRSRTDRRAPSQKGCCRALKDLPPYLSLWMPVLQAQNQICQLAKMDPSLREGVIPTQFMRLAYTMSTHPFLMRNECPEDQLFA